MTDMHPYEALKIALHEARDERDDWRESATRAAGESCGDERHCTCVGPLRKELRDAKAKLAALVTERDKFANWIAKEPQSGPDWACAQCIPPSYGNDMVVDGFVCTYHQATALAAAKVQP